MFPVYLAYFLILTFYLGYILAIYLGHILAFYLALCLTYFLAYILGRNVPAHPGNYQKGDMKHVICFLLFHLLAPPSLVGFCWVVYDGW